MSLATTIAPTAPAAKRTRATRATKKSGDQPTRKMSARTARRLGLEDAPPVKSQDPSLVKCSFYLPVWVHRKLAVAALLRDDMDLSDLASEILGDAVSSIKYFDSRKGDPADQATEAAPAGKVIDGDVTA
jgi:hypothetical protein